MLANVTRLDLRLRRRSTIWYAAGMALYALIVVVLYPSLRHQTSLNSLSGSTAAALFFASPGRSRHPAAGSTRTSTATSSG
jgi:ABC-2 type transport system permease protein